LFSVLFFCLLGYGRHHEISEMNFLSVLLLAVSVSCSFSLCTGLMLPCWFHRHRQFSFYGTLSMPLVPALEVSPTFPFVFYYSGILVTHDEIHTLALR
jgi:hypothetical protein